MAESAKPPGFFYTDLPFSQQKLLYKLCHHDKNKEAFNRIVRECLAFSGDLEILWFFVTHIDPPMPGTYIVQGFIIVPCISTN